MSEARRGSAAAGGGGANSDLITLVGLVLETAAGLQRTIGPALESQFDLAGQDFEILIRLARSPGGRLRMSDLAAQTSLTPSGLTRAIDRLAELGLVRREVCPEDRRGSFAALTEAGGARMTAALDVHTTQLHSMLDGVLSAREQAALTNQLRKVRDRVNPGAASVSD